ncbi:MAG: DUF4282 domain-containing protein [Candidatus Promineifilaceae bacterium]
MDRLQEYAIFDFSFTHFVTTKLVKLLYAIALIFIVIGFLTMIVAGFVSMFNDSFGSGLALLCMSPFVLLIYVLLARVWSEFLIVIFRISENISLLVEQGQEKGGSA